MNIYSWFIYEMLGSDLNKSRKTVPVITWTVMTDPSLVLMEAEQEACPPVHVFMYTCVSTAAMTTSSESFQPHLPILGAAEISTHNARHSELCSSQPGSHAGARGSTRGYPAPAPAVASTAVASEEGSTSGQLSPAPARRSRGYLLKNKIPPRPSLAVSTSLTRA